MQKLNRFSITVVLLLSACAGTDFIEEPAMIVPARIVINPTNTAVEVNKTASFHAVYYDSLGNQVSGVVVQWSSSDTSTAAINSSGLALGKKVGQARVIARARGVTSEPAMLTVVANANQVARVVVAPDSGELAIGGTLQFTAVARNLNGDVLSGKTFNWRSSDASIATISNTGVATGLKAGNVKISASIDGVESSPTLLVVLGTSRSGTFSRNPNTSYSISGTAALEQQPNGSLILHLRSDFTVSNGPGLEVFLSPANTIGTSSLNLGRLQRISGEQSYSVPSGAKLTTYNWVIIHCVPFNVTFGQAQLK